MGLCGTVTLGMGPCDKWCSVRGRVQYQGQAVLPHTAPCHVPHPPRAMCYVPCIMCHVPHPSCAICLFPCAMYHVPYPPCAMCHVPHPLCAMGHIPSCAICVFSCAMCHIHSVPRATCHIPLPCATSVVCLMSRPIVFLLPCHLPHLVTSHCVPHCHTMMCPFPLCANTMCLPMPSATSHPVPCATSHSVLRSTPCHGTPCPPPTLCHSVPRHTPRCASCHLMLPSHAIPRATLLCHIPSHTLHTPSHPLCPSSPHAVPRCVHSVSLHPPPDLTFLSGYCQSVPKFV